MHNPKSYTLPELFSAASLGFTFEFYSSKDINFIVENLSSITLKNVLLTNSINVMPTYANCVLLKEYEGKRPRYSFKMAQQKFDSIVPLVKGVLSWINETSQCTNDTLMRTQLSFDHKHLRTLQSISNMDTGKLILKINENYIYEKFPKQKNSPYSISVKKLLPLTENIYSIDLLKNVNYIIGKPKEKYYGIDFSEYTTGSLNFNYIGGEDYAENQKAILEMLEYYIIKTYQSLNESEYTKDEIYQLKVLTENFYKIQEAYYEPDQFSKLFPDIKVGVDMRRDSQMLKTFWPKIRNTIFELVINNDLKKGEFNYDAAIGVYQLRNAKLNCNNISNFDLVKCEIEGIVKNSNLISCKVNNARLYNSKIVKGNNISDSYLFQISADSENLIEHCFVENNHEVLNCTIKQSIIKFAVIGKKSKLDESSTIIDSQEFLPKLDLGVQVEEIRDYNFIKRMSTTDIQAPYGNEYIKPKYIK